jgi:muramoyltetrapeptide carboxypeptidase LdcA involved in peptidoglycan recycling
MISRIKWVLGALFVGSLALVASWFGGRKAAQTDIKIKGLEDYNETRTRIDQVVRDTDQLDAADWLRERGKR